MAFSFTVGSRETGFAPILLCFTEFFLPDFTWWFWLLLGFTGFYWVLLTLDEFQRVIT